MSNHSLDISLDKTQIQMWHKHCHILFHCQRNILGRILEESGINLDDSILSPQQIDDHG